jgi:hypothetical protein
VLFTRRDDCRNDAKEEKLIFFSRRRLRMILSVALGLILSAVSFTALDPVAVAQDTHQSQGSGVDNTKMGPYRALAHIAYAAHQKGDDATAAQLARILERVWDKAEDYGGDTALSKTNPDLFKQVDKAMDDFVAPLENYSKVPLDAAKLKTAYNAYLEKLKLAD